MIHPGRKLNGINKHIFKILAIILPVFFIGYILESFRTLSSILGDYFEITTELLPLVMSFSIFIITWYAYRQSRDNHSLFLGAAFLMIGLLDLYRMLSYPFMPAFITPNSYGKSAIFESESMLMLALLFLASVHIHKDTFPRLINKSILLVSVITIAFVSLATVLYFPGFIPVLIYPDRSASYIMMAVQIIAAGIVIFTGYLYSKRLKDTKQNNIICLIYGFGIIAFSIIVYNSYGYSGHLLKAAGFYFVYLALYKSSIEEPYEKRAEAEAKLRRTAEERYINLVDNANDAIITTDLDGRITSWNRTAEKVFGWINKEVIGNKLSQLIIPEDKKIENELFIRNILLGGTASGVETVHKRRDGVKINVSLTVSPLYNSNRRIIGLSNIIRDVTERVKAEEIRTENMRLELAIRAKSEFLPALSHDLGTPLNAIIGFSELLKQNIPGELNKKQEQYVDNVIISALRMLDIINDVLDIGKAETGKIDLEIERFPVPETINEIIDFIKEKSVKKNIELRKEFDPGLEFIEADRNRFKQILYNLLSNAVKFSKVEGGTITIKAQKEWEMARFSISDTGIGIREEDMAKLFKSFEQLNLGISSKYGSTGLGLVVTKKLVELHEGKILVESKPDVGSTFTFLIPINTKNSGKRVNLSS